VGVQALIVFAGLATALTVGIVAGVLEFESRLVGWLAIALVPVMWMISHLIEWAIGRKIWEYTAPYPYRWMQAIAVRGRRSA
jgi:hypothetical protein